MKGIRLSEAIEELEELRDNYGDIRIMINNSEGDVYPILYISISEKDSETIVEIQ